MNRTFGSTFVMDALAERYGHDTMIKAVSDPSLAESLGISRVDRPLLDEARASLRGIASERLQELDLEIARTVTPTRPSPGRRR